MTAASAALTRLSPAQAGCVPPQSLRSTVARQFIPDNKFSVLRMRSMSLLPHVCPRGMRHVRDIRRLHFLSLRSVPGQGTARNSIKVMPPLRPLRRTPRPSVSMPVAACWRYDSTTSCIWPFGHTRSHDVLMMDFGLKEKRHGGVWRTDYNAPRRSVLRPHYPSASCLVCHVPGVQAFRPHAGRVDEKSDWSIPPQ